MSIKHAEYPRLTIDDWRRHPGQLVFATDLAAAGIIRSYTAMNRAIKAGAIPPPYRLPGGRLAWEARTVLKMIGAAATVAEVPSEAAEKVEQLPESRAGHVAPPQRHESNDSQAESTIR